MYLNEENFIKFMIKNYKIQIKIKHYSLIITLNDFIYCENTQIKFIKKYYINYLMLYL